MAKIYVAGKLWDNEDRTKIEKIDKFLQGLGHKTFLPHRDAGIYEEGMNPDPIFKKDRDMVDWCDLMVAFLDWQGISSGTAWELGYAHAKGKRVIGFVEDKKSLNKKFRICVMCFNKKVELVENFEELKKLIQTSS